LDLEKQNLADQLGQVMAELETLRRSPTSDSTTLLNQLPSREKLNEECNNLLALSQKLDSDNERLLKKLQDTQAELKELRSNQTDAPNSPLPDLAKIRDRTLAELKLGKQAPGFHQPRPERDED
jgi:chromosome segregation ATPase